MYSYNRFTGCGKLALHCYTDPQMIKLSGISLQKFLFAFVTDLSYVMSQNI